MNHIFSLRLLVILFLISIQTSFAGNTLRQASEYGAAIINSRIEYFQSLRDFLNNSENTIDEKFDLIETFASEKFIKKINYFKNALHLFQHWKREQESNYVISGYSDFLYVNFIIPYQYFLNLMQLGLESIADCPEAIELQNYFIQDLKTFKKESFPNLKWEEVNQRTKMMSAYRFLKVLILNFENEKICKNLKEVGRDVFEPVFEFQSTELPILEDLSQFFLRLMPSEDRQFVGSYDLKKTGKSSGNGCGFAVDYWRACRERNIDNVESLQNLRSGFEKLNREFYRIHQKIEKKLKSKSFVSQLKVDPQGFHLAPLPVDIYEQVNYFLNSAPNLVNELQYVKANVWLSKDSEQVLSDILDLISELEELQKTVSALNKRKFSEAYERTVSRLTVARTSKNNPLLDAIDRFMNPWERDFLDSYVNHLTPIIYFENSRFNRELLKKINRLIQTLEDFDREAVRGNKKPFRVRIKVEKPTTSSKEKTLPIKEFEVEPSGEEKLKQPFVSGGETGNIAIDECQKDDRAESKEDSLRRTEDKQQKIEFKTASLSPSSFDPDREAIEVYSRFSEDSDQPTYTQIVQDHFKMSTKDYKLLQKLFSSNPGGIPFGDLNRLITRCGGIVQEARGSHVKITMPGKKFFSAYRPHRPGRSEKVRNFLLDIYRKALSDVRDRVL